MEFNKIFSRIKKETNIKTMIELAEFIDCSQQNVSARKKKNIFPIEWAYKVGKKYNLLTEWIMEGTGPMRPGGHRFKKDKKIINEIEEWLNEITRKEERKEIWFEIQFEEKFPEFKEWLKKRNSDSEYIVPQKKTA